MIYLIEKDFYIKVGAKYVKLDVKVDNDEIVLNPIYKSKIEDHKDLKVEIYDLNADKDKIIKKLKSKYDFKEEKERFFVR